MNTKAEKTTAPAGHDVLAITAQVCKAEGCKTPITPANRSGYCGRHFGRSRREKTNGHASTVPKNGNGNGHATAIAAVNTPREDRLNQVLIGFPIDTKQRLVTAWLTGEI